MNTYKKSKKFFLFYIYYIYINICTGCVVVIPYAVDAGVQARGDAGGGMMPGRRAPMDVLGDMYELK